MSRGRGHDVARKLLAFWNITRPGFAVPTADGTIVREGAR